MASNRGVVYIKPGEVQVQSIDFPKLEDPNNGKVIEQHLRRELLTRDELMGALRRQGILTIDEVHVAWLEETGGITAVKRERSVGNAQPNTKDAAPR